MMSTDKSVMLTDLPPLSPSGAKVTRAREEAIVADDSKPDLYDHPLAPEHVLLRAPKVQE